MRINVNRLRVIITNLVNKILLISGAEVAVGIEQLVLQDLNSPDCVS